MGRNSKRSYRNGMSGRDMDDFTALTRDGASGEKRSRGIFTSSDRTARNSSIVGNDDFLTLTDNKIIAKTSDVRKEFTIIIDESGDAGKDTPDDPTFTYAATITDRPILFGYIAIKFRHLFRNRLKTGELKAIDLTPEQREEILGDISDLNPEIHAVQIDKYAEDNPDWWSNNRNRKWPFRETLSELMDKTFGATKKDNFHIIVDHNDQIKNGIGEKIVLDSAIRTNKNVIECHVKDSEEKEYGDLIQAIDVIPREVRDRMTGKKGGPNLNIRAERLTDKNVRRKNAREE